MKSAPVERYKFQGLAWVVPDTLAFETCVWLTGLGVRVSSHRNKQ